MKWYTEVKMSLHGVPVDDDRFAALADALYDVEAQTPDVHDADLGAGLADGWLAASMLTEAADQEAAVRKAIAAVRAAIRRVGGGMPDWDQLIDRAALTVELASERHPAAA
jgi:hypothetical protein